MYQPHPSKKLNELFAVRPFQGAEPSAAKFLFVGLDANYAEDIERSPIFSKLVSYHENGASFWRATGVHHPFLLPAYSGDGRRYHRTFAKIGFRPEHAELVSFAELLHLPTVGRCCLSPNDLSRAHLEGLRRVIFKGGAQFIFVSAGVVKLLAATALFPELLVVKGVFGALRVLYEDDDRAIFLHLHFSNYGKFEQQLQAEARDIRQLLRSSEA